MSVNQQRTKDKPGRTDSGASANGHAAAAAADFLQRLFGTAPGNFFILIWTKKGEDDKRNYWLPVGQLDKAAARLARLCTRDAGNVYVGGALSKEDYGPHKRLRDDEERYAAGIPGLWADIDVKGETHKQAKLPETIDQARELARSLGLEPTEEIDSGHGLQVWWLFDKPWIFRDDDDRQKAADLIRRFQALLRKEAKGNDWELDPTHDLARVMRLPGTWNCKTANPVPVRVLTSGGPRYDVGDFLALVPPDDPSDSAFKGRASDGITVIECARRYVATMPPAISGQGGHRATFAVAQVVYRGFSLSEAAGRPIMEEYNQRCQPPWSEKDLDRKIREAIEKSRLPEDYILNRDGRRAFHGSGKKTSSESSAPADPPLPTAPAWPDPLAPEAFHGLAGEIVRALEPASEADPAALLFQFLVGFGNLVGRKAYFAVEADQHFTNEFVVLVGETAKGRKGTSWGQVKSLLAFADESWTKDRIQTGLSSGEGLVWAVRDPILTRQAIKEKGIVTGHQEVETDPGIADKRLLVYEPEFANVLKQTERIGNVLSALLRQAWESGDLRTLTKNSPARASGAHVGLIGHCTAEELRRYLSVTESANGFGNRFLWVCTKRSKLLPLGGSPDAELLVALQLRLAKAVSFARQSRRVGLDEEARAIWCEIYGTLSEGRPGLAGALLQRAEPHVLRLAQLYALLDGSGVIAAPHLMAAVALWVYVEQSVLYMFGNALGDPLADDLLHLLRAAPNGLSRWELSNLLGRNQSAEKIGRALGLLARHGLAHCVQVPPKEGGKRPAELWRAGKAAKAD
jgi:hypothetical protein